MINFKLTSASLLEVGAQEYIDGYVFFVQKDFDIEKFKDIENLLYKPLSKAFENCKFKGAAGTHVLLNVAKDNKPIYLLFIGLGSKDNGCLSIETYRRALGRVIRLSETNKIKSLGFKLPDAELFKTSIDKLACETGVILNKADYHFDEYITDDKRLFEWETKILISTNKDDIKSVELGLEKGVTISKSINLARYYCDLPPSILTPTNLANKAKDIADSHDNLKTTIFGESKIISLGMGGIEGVSRGSQEEAKFVITEYNYSKDAPTVAIVGKGVTFDSGGLSLKPAAAMESMKDDMAGAAVVISTMKAVAELKPKINIIALTPLTENLPSASPLKPGDIIKFYNGKTAEVKNTDAEGRLILADALSYAVKNYKLDAIVDLATLTGACAHALGPFYAALLTQSDSLSDNLLKASNKSGDNVWRLPMDNDYKAAIKSNVADISNIGSQRYRAGSITAAFFLSNFIDETPWAHIDIAGVAFDVPDLSYLRPGAGATGFGVKLLLDFFDNFKV